MDNLPIVFQDGILADKDLGTQLQALGALAYGLCQACHDERSGDMSGAELWMSVVEDFAAAGEMYEVFPLIRAVYSDIVRADEAKNTEFYYHGLFVEFASQIFPGCRVIEHKNDGANIPDVWLSVDDHEIPVEVKLHDFGLKALGQLERYVSVYHAPFGIAVGEKCTVKLPTGYLFVPLCELRQRRDQNKEAVSC